MATVALPTSKAFRFALPHGFGISAPQAGWRGMYTGNTEVSKRGADRLVMRPSFGYCTRAEAAEREAFFGGVISRGDWLSLGLPQRESQPRGAFGGSPVMAVGAGAGARALPVSGARARPNMLSRGTTLDQSPWVASGVTITANTTADPGGSVTSDRVQSNTAGNDFVRQAVTLEVGQTYTLSAYLAAGTATATRLLVQQTTLAASAQFSWTGSAVTSSSVALGVSAGFVSAPASHYRVWVAFVATEASAWVRIYPDDSNTGKNVSVWGVMLETGSTPSAYPGPAALASGDVLSIGGNLIQVDYPGAVADDAGNITIPIVLPLQELVAVSTALVWDSPTGTWELDRSDGISFDYSAAALQQPFTLPLRQRIV